MCCDVLRAPGSPGHCSLMRVAQAAQMQARPLASGGTAFSAFASNTADMHQHGVVPVLPDGESSMPPPSEAASLAAIAHRLAVPQIGQRAGSIEWPVEAIT
ncbi:hypothetical protein VARIO8X_140053 [Burkholderiales bacterium 8X]|nr:hypothetical protein VARIO8X_140053 [Burkholderiales bacterium 8X]